MILIIIDTHKWHDYTDTKQGMIKKMTTLYWHKKWIIRMKKWHDYTVTKQVYDKNKKWHDSIHEKRSEW